MTLEIDELNRRGAIAAAASLVTGVLVSVGGVPVPADAVAQARQNAPASKDRVGDTDDEEEVSATEDLMREHGVLRRTLIVYAERNACGPTQERLSLVRSPMRPSSSANSERITTSTRSKSSMSFLKFARAAVQTRS